MDSTYPMTFSVYIVTLLLVLSRTNGASHGCDRMLKKFNDFYYNDVNTSLSYIDMLSITHGGQAMKKCKHLTKYLKTSQMEYCMEETHHCSGHLDNVIHRMKRQTVECNLEMITCNASNPYREADGSCNNLANPRMGQSDRIQARMLPNAYDDGLGMPRQKGRKGNDLPNPRLVSNMLHQAKGKIKYERKLSYMMMQWGQMIAHDASLTPIAKNANGDAIDCCGTQAADINCLPIPIPLGDKKFKPGGCMDFSRSLARFDCKGVRHQINRQTAALDASQVYGPNLEETEKLRSKKNGTLITNDNRLVADNDDKSCSLSRPMNLKTYFCTKAGDVRVNEQAGLSSLHTIFVREHNYLAKKLAKLNPQWDDERLFQEVRRIVGAEMQNINYAEYLPIVLGPSTMQTFDLNIEPTGFKDTYDPAVDMTSKNVFTTAAFRFGHTMIDDVVGMMSMKNSLMSVHPLKNNFFEPNLYHLSSSRQQYGLEYIIKWTTSARCPKTDGQLQPSVRDELYKDVKGKSFDLATLNIQRGRDHGLPGYNEFREECGLPRAMHFGTGRGGLVNHCTTNARRLQSVYRCPDDIDVFAGGLSEKRVPGGVVGPTFACIIARQFKALRSGDRFWFERNDTTTGFTQAQVNEIKKRRLSSIICSTTAFGKVQKNVFLRPKTGNRNGRYSLFDCGSEEIPDINLQPWKE